MAFALKAFTSLLGTGILGSTAYYIFDSMIPKTRGGVLIWEGKPLNKEHKLFVGNYADNIEKIRLEIPEAGFTLNDTIHEGTQKLIRWCEQEFNKEIIDNLDQKYQSKIDRYCFGNVETVKGKLSAAGIVDWIDVNSNTEEVNNQFKYIFAIYKYDSDFKTWVGSGITENDKPSTGYTKLKNKCKDELKKPLKDYPIDNYKYLSWWCTKTTPLTVEQRIKEQNSSWTRTDNFEKAYDDWKYTPEVPKTIKNSLTERTEKIQYNSISSSSSGKTVKGAVKKFCEEGLKKNVYEDGMYRDKYQKIMSVCKKKST